MKILFGDLNAKVGREDIFKPTTGNERLHKISKNDGIIVVNFCMSKTLSVISTMFPHRNIHKYTWTFPDGNNDNHIDHILIGEGIQVYLTSDHSGQQTVIRTTILWRQNLERDYQ
jgi:hypothetical protein